MLLLVKGLASKLVGVVAGQGLLGAVGASMLVGVAAGQRGCCRREAGGWFSLVKGVAVATKLMGVLAGQRVAVGTSELVGVVAGQGLRVLSARWCSWVLLLVKGLLVVVAASVSPALTSDSNQQALPQPALARAADQQ